MKNYGRKAGFGLLWLGLLAAGVALNASKASVSKHASPEEYRASTGFECLLGWLYLNGQLDRVHELFDTLWQQFDPNETR